MYTFLNKAILTEKEHKLLTLEKLRQQENQFAVSLEDEMRQLLIAIDQIKEEKAQSEDCHRAETEKFELKEKYMVELQVENNRMETDRKTYILNETFAQFWNNNLLKEKQIKIAEEQANLQKDMLDRQQAVLDETSRLLFAATTAVTEMSLATQRPSPTSAPVSPAAAVIASTSVLTSTSAFERELKADLQDQTRFENFCLLSEIFFVTLHFVDCVGFFLCYFFIFLLLFICFLFLMGILFYTDLFTELIY